MLSRLHSLGQAVSGNLTPPLSRLLHTAKRAVVVDSQKQVKAVILKTCSDIIPDELNENYIKRSLLDFAEQIPKDLQGKPLLMFRSISQSLTAKHYRKMVR